MIVTISKGLQLTIPAQLRKILGIRAGSKVSIELRKSEIVIKPVGDDLERVFQEARKIRPRRHLSAKRMDELSEGLFR